MSLKTCCSPSCCSGDEQKNSQAKTANSSKKSIRDNVRDIYTKVANLNKIVKASKANNNDVKALGCCDVANDANLHAQISTRLGYTQADLDLLPEGADMGLGCGNPRAMADLQTGETLVDLGSGGGLDCFLASPLVGETGRVIGVDMTADMISKARDNAERNVQNGKLDNVEFRLGEIEQLPIADNTADVIISNCVINLSPDKKQVFKEAHRVLKTGGRLVISDVVNTDIVPEDIRNDPMMIAGCMGNTVNIDDVESDLKDAGFTQIDIQVKEESRNFIKDWAPGTGAEKYIVAANIEARKR